MKRNVGQALPDNKIKSHSQEFLLGISHIRFCTGMYEHLLNVGNKQMGDPRQRHSGMTTKGFTLIELLVVVLIIGILAAVALPQYQHAVNKTRAVQTLTAVKKVAEAERLYYLEHNSYTKNPYDLDIAYPISTDGKSFVLPAGGECIFNYIKDSGNERAQCSLRSPNIVLQQYLKENRLDCISYSIDNYRGDKYCEQLTGKTTWYNGCGSGCHVYTKRG